MAQYTFDRSARFVLVVEADSEEEAQRIADQTSPDADAVSADWDDSWMPINGDELTTN